MVQADARWGKIRGTRSFFTTTRRGSDRSRQRRCSWETGGSFGAPFHDSTCGTLALSQRKNPKPPTEPYSKMLTHKASHRINNKINNCLSLKLSFDLCKIKSQHLLPLNDTGKFLELNTCMAKVCYMEIYYLHEVYIKVGSTVGLHWKETKNSSYGCIFWGLSRTTSGKIKRFDFPKKKNKIVAWKQYEVCGVGKSRTPKARQSWIQILVPHFQSYVLKQVYNTVLVSVFICKRQKYIYLARLSVGWGMYTDRLVK